ncbi:hypothetical protein HRbin06_00906 [archaeon HR06]|nr:hypothetical protein HRbin06_00906 [archaeon HR06]
MKAIFEEEVKPRILKEIGRKYNILKTLKIYNIMESSLALIIQKIVKDNPDVYIKSHPKGKEIESPYIELDLQMIHENEKLAKEKVERLAIELAKIIKDKGGKVEEIP